MELFEAIKTRRSIRKFKMEAIPDEYIYEILEAGRLAPSGTNIQATRYIVIKSSEGREKLKDCTPLPFVTEAPVVIVCCTDSQAFLSMGKRMEELKEAKAFKDTPLDNADSKTPYKSRMGSMDQASIKAYLNLNAAIAIDHMTLRATDLGLGSCWVMMFDREKLKMKLELEDQYDIVALLPIGYSEQAPAPRPRLCVDELIIKQM